VTDGGPAAAATPSSREAEVLQAAVQQFYEDRIPPPEIHVPLALPESDGALLEEWLSSKAGRRVRLVVPRRGEKRGLLELAARNAELAYQQRFNENTGQTYDASRNAARRPGAARRAAPHRVPTSPRFRQRDRRSMVGAKTAMRKGSIGIQDPRLAARGNRGRGTPSRLATVNSSRSSEADNARQELRHHRLIEPRPPAASRERLRFDARSRSSDRYRVRGRRPSISR
jgi:hypothetical protein